MLKSKLLIFFSFLVIAFSVLSNEFCLLPGHEDIFLYFIQRVYSFTFMFKSCLWFILINICWSCGVEFLPMWISSHSSTFAEVTFLSPLNCFGTFVKSKLSLVTFWLAGLVARDSNLASYRSDYRQSLASYRSN